MPEVSHLKQHTLYKRVKAFWSGWRLLSGVIWKSGSNKTQEAQQEVEG